MSSFTVIEPLTPYSVATAMEPEHGIAEPAPCSGELAAREREQGSEEELSEAWPQYAEDPRDRILALYDEYRPRLFRYLCSMHLRRETAEEVIQETFMRLTAVLLKHAEIDNVQGWIVRVAHNLAIDTLKKSSAGAIGGEEVLFLLANRADPALNPEEAYVKKEKDGRMDAALATLKPQHRDCFQMRAHGFRYKTIGQAMGISEQRAAFVVKQVAVRLAALCG